MAIFFAPTFVVNGSEDRESVRSTAADLVQKFKTAELQTIEPAGHSLLIESPKALGDLVRDFLERVPA